MQSGFYRKPDCIFVWFIDGDTIMNYNIRDVWNEYSRRERRRIQMKELERSNRVAMIAHGVINACMLFISVIGFVEHIVSAPVLVVLMLLGIIPVLAEFICWKRDHATKAIKHLSMIGFALFYTVLLFTAQCNMVYAFVIPMMFAVMPYHDVKAFALINVGTLIENVLVVLLGATQGGIWLSGAGRRIYTDFCNGSAVLYIHLCYDIQPEEH